MKNRILTLILLLACAFGLALSGPGQALAQQLSDTWSGHDEHFITISTSISTTAALKTAVTGKVLNVRSMVITSDTAGVVVFQDGSGGTAIGKFYCAANTPQQIPEHILGQGMKTSSGNGLYAVLGSATLTFAGRIRYDPN